MSARSSRSFGVCRRAVLRSSAGLLASTWAHRALGQQAGYPSRPITMVIGYPPGGSTDLTGRIVAPELSKALGVPVVVENVSGAVGAIAAQRVLGSAPDGYTILVGANSDLAINRLVSSSARYLVSDFTPIGLISAQPLVVAASQKIGVKTIDQFLEALRQAPGRLSYGTSGTLLQMAGEMVKQQAKVSINHVPYRGAGPLIADLLGGHVDFGVLVLAGAMSHLRSGKLIAIGTTEEKRSPFTPDVPALAEHPAFGGFSINAWFAMMAPPNVPEPVADRLRAALAAALESNSARKSFEELGAVVSSPPSDLKRYLTDEAAKYGRIAEVAGIRPE